VPRSRRVLIVGAGIAGLALARRLLSLGLEVELIERSTSNEAHGAGILLTGNAVRVLEGLGLGPVVAQQGRPVQSVRFADERDRCLFELELAAQPRWPVFLSIQRAALQQILLDAARPATPRWATTIVSLKQAGDEVDVLLSDGRRCRYGLVVGADGVHSQTRGMLFGAPAPQPIAGFHGWRFLAPCPKGLDAPCYMLGNGRTFLLHPLPEGLVYCGAGPVHDAALAGASEHGRLHKAFADFAGHAGEVLSRLHASTRLIPTRYWHVAQRPWHVGSCVLIGDAAHACAPTLAQGGAMALEDAWVLGELLAAQRTPLGEALVAFEARRAPRVQRVQALSLERMAANRPLDARALALRNSVLSRIGAAQLLDAWSPLMEGSP
jgi:2-polyprenyl-6-methoxyphenol hydroxylase-like FAD-dependent oxidoreductase